LKVCLRESSGHRRRNWNALHDPDKHRNQRRKDAEASPYINHPIALANLLANEAGIADERVLIAVILHDTIEDTETIDKRREQDLLQAFGAEVAAVVMEVTDNKKLDKAERKRLPIAHAPHARREAKLVKLADKTCNLRDMAFRPPADRPLERQREYFDWAKAVIDGLRGSHPILEQIFDAAYGARPT